MIRSYIQHIWLPLILGLFVSSSWGGCRCRIWCSLLFIGRVAVAPVPALQVVPQFWITVYACKSQSSVSQAQQLIIWLRNKLKPLKMFWPWVKVTHLASSSKKNHSTFWLLHYYTQSPLVTAVVLKKNARCGYLNALLLLCVGVKFCCIAWQGRNVVVVLHHM